MFTKLTDFLSHMGDIVTHVLAMADKGMAIDQALLDKAKAAEATIKPFIALMSKSPVTVHVPVPDQHAAVLGAK